MLVNKENAKYIILKQILKYIKKELKVTCLLRNMEHDPNIYVYRKFKKKEKKNKENNFICSIRINDNNNVIVGATAITRRSINEFMKTLISKEFLLANPNCFSDIVNHIKEKTTLNPFVDAYNMCIVVKS